MSCTLDIPTVISFLALGISFVTLYFSYLRSGKIDVLPPRMCYFQYVQDTAFRPSIVLPLTFVNSGARIASVLNLILNVEFVPENGGNIRNLRFALVSMTLIQIHQKKVWQHSLALKGTKAYLKPLTSDLVMKAYS